MSNTFVINYYRGRLELWCDEHAQVLPPVESVLYIDGKAYRVAELIQNKSKRDAVIHGWVAFVEPVPVEETSLGIQFPEFYTPDGDEL